MGFKPNPNKKVRLDELSKAALIKTVKALQRRETKLLNEVAALKHDLERQMAISVAEINDTEGPSFMVPGVSANEDANNQEREYLRRSSYPWEK